MTAFKGERFPQREVPEEPSKIEKNVARVPESEIGMEYVRSSGPGGQNVNKISSKARLRWNVGNSPHFSEAEKSLIRETAGHRLNGDDEIVLASDAERSQARNRDDVIERLDALIEDALTPKKERKPTRVSRSQKRKRLEDKKKIGRKKQLRKPPKGEW